jgi:hypothetical protein
VAARVSRAKDHVPSARFQAVWRGAAARAVVFADSGAFIEVALPRPKMLFLELFPWGFKSYLELGSCENAQSELRPPMNYPARAVSACLAIAFVATRRSPHG